MQIAQLIKAERVANNLDSSSKKRTLEQLSQLLASAATHLTADEIFDGLVGRERLGSTGLGHGVAIPHGRIAGLTEPVGAFTHLSKAVDFDAIDRKPVDLLFALLVPEESTEEHLQLLAQLARMFGNADFCTQLRKADSDSALYELIQHWEASHTPA